MNDAPIKTLWDNDRAMREIESLRQQLETSQKREVMLRGFVKLLRDYIPASAVGNMTVQEALAAAADLSGLILCHADVSIETSASGTPYAIGIAPPCTDFYRAWEQK